MLLIRLAAYRVRLQAPRARAHWIGYHRRPHRPERAFYILLFASAMILLEPYQFLLWSIALGAGTSLFLLLHTIYQFVPRRRAHWVR
jgi:hypothetical protein